MSIKRIFIAISAIFAASAVFADNSSVTSKKYVDDLMSGYQGKLPGSGANTLMIYDEETGIGEKSIAATLGNSASAVSVPTVGAVKTGLDGKQDTITGTAGYVMTGTSVAGNVGERPIYGTSENYAHALVTAETVNTGVVNAVNNSLIRVNENGRPDINGTLWEISDDLIALSTLPLPTGYTQLEYISFSGTSGTGPYIDTGLLYYTDIPNTSVKIEADAKVYNGTGWQVVTGNLGINTAYIGLNGNNKIAYSVGTNDNATAVSGSENRCIWILDAKNKTVSVTDTTTEQAILNLTNIATTTRNVDLSVRIGGFQNSDKTDRPERTHMDLYSIKIYNNGVLVRDMIPCKNSSNIVGLYDAVTGNFYTNPTTTSNVTPGPAVVGN